MNHPAPGDPANVKLVDFDLPYTFFPSYFMRFLPYIDAKAADWQMNKAKDVAKEPIYKATAVLS